MNKKIRGLLNALMLLCAVAAAGAARAELAIIAHPSSTLVGISREELKDIYLGRTRTFPNGVSVTVVDQAPDTPARSQFLRDVLGMSEQALRSHWAKLMFTGKAKSPQVLDSDEAVRKAVAGDPNGIGYVQGRYVDASVKVLLILP